MAGLIRPIHLIHRGDDSMQTRQLGNSDLHITPLGIGAWAIGGPGYAFAWGPQNDDDSIRRECEASLRRLRVDTIDLYQLHWPEPDADIEDGWAEMARLKEEGKV